MVQLSYLDALRRGPDDHRHVLWLNTEDQLLQSVPLLLAPYLLGNRHLVRKGDKDQVAPRKGELCGESGTLGGDGLLGYLDHHFIASLELISDVSGLGDRLLQFYSLGRKALTILTLCAEEALGCQEATSQITVVEKRLSLVPNVDEGGIETGHDFLHRAEIDISHRERDVLLLSPELH